MPLLEFQIQRCTRDFFFVYVLLGWIVKENCGRGTWGDSFRNSSKTTFTLSKILFRRRESSFSFGSSSLVESSGAFPRFSEHREDPEELCLVKTKRTNANTAIITKTVTAKTKSVAIIVRFLSF